MDTLENKLLDERKYKDLLKKRNIAIALDIYGASGPIATLGAGGAAATVILSPVAAVLAAYAGFTEAADVITGPATGLYIKEVYGETGLGIIEAIAEFAPLIGDLFPGVSLAHNIYLDKMAKAGYAIPDQLYVMPKVYDRLRPVFDMKLRLNGTNNTGEQQ